MLKSLPENERNLAITLPQIKKLHKHQFTLSQIPAVYFPYNHDTRDQGWGCAWRAIQMLLTYRKVFISFQDLYSTYSKRQCLQSVIKKQKNFSQQTLSQLSTVKWIPEQLDNHWAEPFIASLICTSLQIKNDLLLLNGYPQANAPFLVFQNKINFAEFIQAVKKNIYHSSIMIDDGQYALSIIGFRQTNEDIQFLFADPHIRSNRGSKDVGLYSKQFTFAGKSKQDKRSQTQKVESLYNVYAALEFQNKAWMICFLNN